MNSADLRKNRCWKTKQSRRANGWNSGNTTLHYKGYTTRIEYSEEDGCFVGDLVGIRDIVCFHAGSLEEIRIVFEESVDDYLLACKEFNRQPQKPVLEM